MPPVVGIHDDNPCLIRNLDIAVVGIVLFKVRLKPLAILPVISWVDVVAVDVIADRHVSQERWLSSQRFSVLYRTASSLEM